MSYELELPIPSRSLRSDRHALFYSDLQSFIVPDNLELDLKSSKAANGY